MKMKTCLTGSCIATVILAACSSMPGGGPSAAASLKPTKGNTASADISFRQDKDGVLISAEAQGLPPGPHGFHIHEKGDCSAPDGTSAGGHFNPDGQPHGDPMAGAHHAGDMPMLMADAGGKAHLETRLPGLTIGSGANDIVGRGVIIHAGADDFKTQPTGNSGGRLACGVIVAN